MKFFVAQFRNGKFEAVVSGLGRNRGTWNYTLNTKGTANRHCRRLNRDPKRAAQGLSYKVETSE